MEPRARLVARRTGACALVAGATLLATSCSVRGGLTETATAAGRDRSRPSDEMIAGLDGSGPSTSASTSSTGPAGSTTIVGRAPEGGPGTGPDAGPGEGSAPGDGDGSSGGAEGGPGDGGASDVPPLGSGDCGGLAYLVIPPAHIITDADFRPPEERTGTSPSLRELADMAGRVAVVAPSSGKAAWRSVAATMARAAAEHRPLTAAEQREVQAARNLIEGWARAACPDLPPGWRCDHFGSAGGGPDVAPTEAEAATPEAVLRRTGRSGAAVVERTADVVLYGWVDRAGFLTRTLQVQRVGRGWATARVHVCHGA